MEVEEVKEKEFVAWRADVTARFLASLISSISSISFTSLAIFSFAVFSVPSVFSVLNCLCLMNFLPLC